MPLFEMYSQIDLTPHNRPPLHTNPSTSTIASSIPATFRAYRYAQHGAAEDVLKLHSDVKQVSLEPTQVRVKVHSAAINPVDIPLMANYLPSLLSSHPTPEHPFGFGFDGAGTVVEVGSGVKDAGGDLQLGDAVYFMTSFAAFGSFAEYFTLDHAFVARKPKTLSFDQAAGVPLVALTSYQALKEHAKLQSGERVLILGGSSATGIYGIQIAKAIGAHVTVTASTRNVAFVKSLGADKVIEYTTIKWVDALPSHSVDVIYDCGVEANAWNTDAQTVLRKETGRFVTLLRIQDPVIESKFGAKNCGQILVYPSASQLVELAELIDGGKVVTPIDSLYSFENVQEAVAHTLTGRATGKLVIQIAPNA
uniref:Enoyl reductase (ER) domain-containing protein n=1 Tax=Globisporangium ultimum (strain ATCC 200006 / CBS 805.95 / DAOM BR144) TaxID=431595 RepID=K3WF45_GLOUD